MFDDEFNELMKIKAPRRLDYRALIVLLYLSGVRISEAIESKRKQFHRTTTKLYYDVGVRKKHSKTTPALPISLKAPHVSDLVNWYLRLEPDRPLFDFSVRTGRNVITRFKYYPHYYRANRITRFFLDGFTIPEVKGWTGLNTKNLDYYVMLASTVKLGESLATRGGEFA